MNDSPRKAEGDRLGPLGGMDRMARKAMEEVGYGIRTELHVYRAPPSGSQFYQAGNAACRVPAGRVVIMLYRDAV